jgi:hypothetical protein
MFNFRDWDKEPELIGVYTGQYKNVGPHKTNVFVFREEGKKVVHSWAYSGLVGVLYGVPFQTKIRLKYLGMYPMPDNPDHSFKNFEIEILQDLSPETIGFVDPK